MLASSSMRAAAQRWSPLVAALVLSGAALFFGGGSGDGSLPWLGGAAIVLALVFAATRPVPGRAAPVRAARAARRLVGGLGRVVDRARPELGVREPRPRLPRLRARRRVRRRPAEGADVGVAAMLGAVCVWALAGKALPWLYEDYGRIARLRAPVGYWNALALLGAIALPIGLCLATRRRVPGRCSSTAGSSRSR